MRGRSKLDLEAYCLGDVVDHNCAIRVAIVHRGQGLVSFLTSSVPYLKFDRRALVEGYRLGEKGGTDRRFPIIVELVLQATCQKDAQSTFS